MARHPLAVLALPALLAGVTALQAQVPAPLFRAAPPKGAAAAPLRLDAAVVRGRRALVDLERLLPSTGTLPTSAQWVELNLFPDAVYRALLTPYPAPIVPYVAWRGPIDGIEGSQVVLVAGGGQIAATINALDRQFRVRYAGEESGEPAGEAAAVHAVEEIEPAPLPDGVEIAVAPAKAGGWTPGSTPRVPPPTLDDGSTIDVLVLYTPVARDLAGGTQALRNEIALGIEEMTTAFERSGIPTRARLVGTLAVDYTESPEGLRRDLDLLTTGRSGLDLVHAWRDSYRADLVALVRGADPDWCGYANLLDSPFDAGFEDSAFSAINATCLGSVYPYLLAHELGHNLGCNHAHQDPTGQGAFDYSFGYKDPQQTFHTVMAYGCSPRCPAIANYSSPDVRVQGRATGSESEDNTRSINNVRTLVANFRGSAPTAACAARLGAFKACMGGGCSVCTDKVGAYPLYFLHHPACTVNAACGTPRRFQTCSRSCPPPTAADR